MWQYIALLTLGLFFLWKGSDLTVSSAKRLADKYGISHTLIGLSVLSVGTSLPEIFTNVYSGIQVASGVDASGIAVGTVIGSEIGQITLILGITALVGTLRCQQDTIRRDGSMLLVAIAAMFLAALDGRITRLEGGLLVAGYVAYLVFLARTYRVVERISNDTERPPRDDIRPPIEAVRIAAGLAVLIIGGSLVVDNAVLLAGALDIATSLVGILVIGVGTSLPELSIAVAGVRRDAAAVSLGSLIGSNITDPMLSLGSGAVIAGFDVDKSLLRFDIPFWCLATIIALWLLRSGDEIGKQDRREGSLLIALFVVFVVLKLVVAW